MGKDNIPSLILKNLLNPTETRFMFGLEHELSILKNFKDVYDHCVFMLRLNESDFQKVK